MLVCGSAAGYLSAEFYEGYDQLGQMVSVEDCYLEELTAAV